MQRHPNLLGKQVQIVLGISVGLYALALFTPALTFVNHIVLRGNIPGVVCLSLGPIWLFANLAQALHKGPSQLWSSFAWLANPLLLVGIASMIGGNYRKAGKLTLVAGGLALLTLALYFEDPENFSHPHFGFYAWVSSMFSMSIGAFVLQLRKNNSPS